MRKGEIYALEWSDIYDNTIHVRRSIIQKLKGGDRETPPKNRTSNRDIQIPTPLSKILDEHKEKYKQAKTFAPKWKVCGGERSVRDTSVSNKNIQYS